jgi:hypothetical protein
VKIKALREAGLRTEHVAFSFMKRRVQPLMARDTLGYQYTSEGDSSRMPGGEIDDDDIIDRLQDLQGHAGVHALSGPRVLRRSTAERDQ